MKKILNLVILATIFVLSCGFKKNLQHPDLWKEKEMMFGYYFLNYSSDSLENNNEFGKYIRKLVLKRVNLQERIYPKANIFVSQDASFSLHLPMKTYYKHMSSFFNQRTFDSGNLVVVKTKNISSNLLCNNKNIAIAFTRFSHEHNLAKISNNQTKSFFLGFTFFNDLNWLKNFANLQKLYIPCMLNRKVRNSVSLKNNKNNVESLSLPKGLEKLKVLNINNNQRTFDYSSLKNVNLSALTMNHANIENLQYIEHMPLEILTVTDSPLKDISGLKKLIKLQDIDLNNNDVITDYSPLKELNNLENVKLMVNQSDDNFSMNYLKKNAS